MEGWVLVHDFFDREKINFSLLKADPLVKDGWETYCEKTGKRDPALLQPQPLGIPSEMPSRNNITLSGAMKIST